jgi:hypothetical protein
MDLSRYLYRLDVRQPLVDQEHGRPDALVIAFHLALHHVNQVLERPGPFYALPGYFGPTLSLVSQYP